MRKILLLVAVLFSTATIALAAIHSSKAYYRTYSVASNSFATEFMTFENYHAILQMNNLTRVKDNGDFEVVIEYMKGLQVAIPQTSSADGRPYYSIPVTAPIYNVKIYNKKKEVVLDKNYGGAQSIIDFEKGMYSTETELKKSWNQQGTKFLQRIEFQNLKFEGLQQEFTKLADKLEDAAPIVSTQQTKTVIDSDAEDIFATPEENNYQDNIVKETNLSSQRTFGSTPVETEDATSIVSTQQTKTVTNMDVDDMDIDDTYVDDMDDIFSTSEETTLTLEERLEIAKVAKRNMNIIKLNLFPLALRNISLNYERILADRQTASLTVNAFIPGASAPSFLSSLVSSDSPDTDNFSGFSVTGDYRFYGNQKGAPKGFYYAPFVKFANHKYSFNTTIEDNFSRANTALTTYGVGIQIGTQWVIKNRFVIDWGILGVSLQQYNFTSTFTATGDINFEEIRESIETDIGDTSFIGSPVEFTSGDDFLKANLPFLFGGLRSYLSVGMQF